MPFGNWTKTCFLVGQTHLPLRKTRHVTFQTYWIDVYDSWGNFLLMVLVVVWGILQKYGFSGERKPLNKMQTPWPLTNQMFFLLRNFNISPGSYLLRASHVIHFSQYLGRWPFFACWTPTFDPLKQRSDESRHLQVSQRCREYCQPTDVQWRRSGGEVLLFFWLGKNGSKMKNGRFLKWWVSPHFTPQNDDHF